MAQQTFALLTTKGRAKEASALASGKGINISHIAIGSGQTVPSGGETKLYNEVLRKTISGNGLVAGAENTAYFDVFLDAKEGPFTIREAGLFDSDGDLIAIAYYDPAINKPTPDSGQTVEGIIRIEVAFSNVANITIKVDPSLNVPLQRLTVTPWLPVKAIDVATPPDNAIIGDCYIIAKNSEGTWYGHDGKLAEFTQAGWSIINTLNGHGIGLPDGRVFTKANGTYVEILASREYVETRRISSAQLMNTPWLPIKALDVTSPVTNAIIGDAYIIPTSAKGDWSGKVGQLAEWNGKEWKYSTTPDGHGVGLPDGRLFIKTNGAYVEKIALDVQSGKWNYAETGGTANALTITLNPVPTMPPNMLAVKFTTSNTSTATLKINTLGTYTIRRLGGSDLQYGDIVSGGTGLLVWDGNNYQLVTIPIGSGGVAIYDSAGTYVFTIPKGISKIKRLRIWGAGGGGGGSSSTVGFGGGGGSGAYGESTDIGVVAGQTIVVTVGKGGTAGAANTSKSGNGGTSSFGQHMSVLGGNGAYGSAGSVGSIGTGAPAPNSQVALPGNNGTEGFTIANAYQAGAGGGAPFGSGATPPRVGYLGRQGLSPGGGGGGCAGYIGIGGAGADGLVIVEY